LRGVEDRESEGSKMKEEKKRIQEVLEAIYALFIQLLTMNY